MDHQEEIKLLFVLIEKHRLFKGLNKRELCIQADITPEYYSELLHGKKIPSIAIVFKLLNAVDCELKPVFKS